MRNVFFLLLGIAFFALAYYVYWIVAQENAVTTMTTTRGVAPRSVGPPPSAMMAFVQEWQPVLTLASSLGGIASFLFQVRVWVRGKG